MKTTIFLIIASLITTSLIAAPPAATGKPPAEAAEPAAPIPLSGAVVETMDAGGYTYLLVEYAGGKIWVAGKPVKTAVGDKVHVADGMMMKDFESRTLKRTFDWILFASAVEINGQSVAASTPALPAGHPPIPESSPSAALPAGHPPLPTTVPPAAAHPVGNARIEVKPGTIEKVAGGYTVAECYAQKKKLQGQTIQIRGVVVKFSAEIMGKNWIHLRDGTGTADASDLTLTTTAIVKVGDTIVAKGRLVCDKDFGSGYKYAVLVEDAVITTP